VKVWVNPIQMIPICQSFDGESLCIEGIGRSLVRACWLCRKFNILWSIQWALVYNFLAKIYNLQKVMMSKRHQNRVFCCQGHVMYINPADVCLALGIAIFSKSTAHGHFIEDLANLFNVVNNVPEVPFKT